MDTNPPSRLKKSLLVIAVILLTSLIGLVVGNLLSTHNIFQIQMIAGKPQLTTEQTAPLLSCNPYTTDPIINHLRRVVPQNGKEEQPLHADTLESATLKWRAKMHDGIDAYFTYPLEGAYFIHSERLGDNEIESRIVQPTIKFLKENGYTIPDNFDIPAFSQTDETYVRRVGFYQDHPSDSGDEAELQTAAWVLEFSKVDDQLLTSLSCASLLDPIPQSIELREIYKQYQASATVKQDSVINYLGNVDPNIDTPIYSFDVIEPGSDVSESFREYWIASEDGKIKMVERLPTVVSCLSLETASLTGRCYDAQSGEFKN